MASKSLEQRKTEASNRKKRNYYKKEREHEREIAMWQAFSRDPELKYFIGMAAGAGVAALGELLDGLGAQGDEGGGQGGSEKSVPWAWLLSSTAVGASPIAWLELIDWKNGDGSGSGLSGQIGNILSLGGTGFSGTCAMILILRSIFSGTDFGELVDSVTPFT